MACISWLTGVGLRASVPGAGRIAYLATLVVDLMVEMSEIASSPATEFARCSMRALARYREPRNSRSIFEIAVTLVPFAALWASAWLAVHLSFFLGISAAGFLVRLFMIQHDCGH